MIQNIPDDTEFKTQTRGEIGRIEWFDIDVLPGGPGGCAHENRSKLPPRGGSGSRSHHHTPTHTPRRGRGGRRTPAGRGRGGRRGGRGNRRYSTERTYVERSPSNTHKGAPRFTIPLKVCTELRRWVENTRAERLSESSSGRSSKNVSPVVVSVKKASPTYRYRRVMPERSALIFS